MIELQVATDSQRQEKPPCPVRRIGVRAHPCRTRITSLQSAWDTHIPNFIEFPRIKIVVPRMLGYSMDHDCFNRLGRQGVLMSGELGSGESRGLTKVALMWRTAGLAAASADHGKGRGARKKARQSVGDDAKKSKKWCVLVHFGARRTLNMHSRAARFPSACDRARLVGHRPKNRKSDAKRCIMMHGRCATFEIGRILRVRLTNNASRLHQRTVA